MSEICASGCAHRAMGHENGAAVARATRFLSLAATPTFAIMALLAAGADGGSEDTLCSVMQHASPLSGMVAMYLLMSAFHSAPWLRLISGRRKVV